MSRIEFLETPIKTEVGEDPALIIAKDTDYDDVYWVMTQHHVVETKGVEDDYELSVEETLTNVETLFRALIANATEDKLSQMLGSLGFKLLWKLQDVLTQQYGSLYRVLKIAGVNKMLHEVFNSNGVEDCADYFIANPQDWGNLLQEYAHRTTKGGSDQ